MPRYCAAFNCSSSSEKNPDLIFHMFPDPSKDEELRQKWEHTLKRKNTPGRAAKICSLHFKDTDYDPPVKITAPKRLKKDAVPSVFNFLELLSPKKVTERRPLVRDISNEIRKENVSTNPLIEEAAFKNVAVQTTLTGIELVETLAHLRSEKKRLQRKFARLNRRVSTSRELLELHKKNSHDSTAEGIVQSNFESFLPVELFENVDISE